MNRRTLLRRLGSAAVATTVASSGATALDSNRQGGKSQPSNVMKVIYADNHGKIIEKSVGEHIIMGAKSKKDYLFLMEKRKELVFGENSSDNPVSIASHSDSGTNRTEGYWFNDSQLSYQIESEFWATSDNGDADVRGRFDAVWWGEGYWVDNPKPVEKITLSSEITAYGEGFSSLHIGVGAGYDYQLTNDSVTLTAPFSNSNAPSLTYDEGVVTFRDASCYRKLEQHNTAEFKFSNEAKYVGHTIVADIGHCGDWI